MKYSLIKYWRRHVNDTESNLKRYQLKVNGELERHENSWRFSSGRLLSFSGDSIFLSVRLLHEINLKTGISLKDLDYRVTSPCKCAYTF